MKNLRIAVVLMAAALGMLTALPARADFDDVVRALERKAGRHHTPVPLFGLVRFAVQMIHPDGVHDIQMAVWEGNRPSLGIADVAPLLGKNTGAGYRPVISSRSSDGEWTYIYGRPRGRELMELIIVTQDDSDTVALRAVVEPEVLAREMDSTREHRHGVAFARK